MGCYAGLSPQSISGVTDRGLIHGRAINNSGSGFEAQHLDVRSDAAREASRERSPLHTLPNRPSASPCSVLAPFLLDKRV